MMPLSMKTYLALLWGMSVSNVMASDMSVNSTAESHTPADTSVEPEPVIATSAGAAHRSLHDKVLATAKPTEGPMHQQPPVASTVPTAPASASVAEVAMSSQQPSSTAKLFKQTLGGPSASATPPIATSPAPGPPTAGSPTFSFTTGSPISTTKTTAADVPTTGNVPTTANVSTTANIPNMPTVSTTTTANVPTTANVSTTANIPNIPTVSTTTTANVPTTANVSTTANIPTIPTVSTANVPTTANVSTTANIPTIPTVSTTAATTANVSTTTNGP
uniref:Uncharacterized protein n=2 Tax=Gasterosteus aculeatus TaxID=69293 RepID=G3PXS5_GASAC